MMLDTCVDLFMFTVFWICVSCDALDSVAVALSHSCADGVSELQVWGDLLWTAAL